MIRTVASAIGTLLLIYLLVAIAFLGLILAWSVVGDALEKIAGRRGLRPGELRAFLRAFFRGPQ